MDNSLDIRRLEVETPLGVVHLAGFSLMQPADGSGSHRINHREVIFRILSEVSGVSVSAEDLCEVGENRRPEFPKLNFDANWTHSGGYCILAYGAPGVRVGVDLERYSQRHLRLSDRFYSEDEAAYLRTLASTDEQRQLGEFFRLWCRKEALFKCVGGRFFEGAVGRSVLSSPVMAGPENHLREVHLVDLDGKKGAGFPAALCIAVSIED